MNKTLIISYITLLLLSSCNSNTTNTNENKLEISQEFIDEHNSRNSLDWPGTYEGNLPCADCPNLNYTVIINEDSTFKTISIYEGKSKEPYIEEGKFTWDKTGSIITLNYENGFNKFKIKEGSIEFLDQDGNSIESPFKDQYQLKKTIQ